MTRRATAAGMPVIATDFLFLLVLVFVLLINPPTSDGDIANPGNISITVSWPSGPIDVDMWVQAPGNGRPTGYSNRGGRVFNLLRDDIGTAGDSLDANIEHAYSRGIPAGEYILNLHCFACPSGPVPVAWEVRTGAPGARQELLFDGKVTLNHGQEVTAIRFLLDAGGNVVPGSTSTVTRNLRSGG